ncbi:MAG: fumarylacetoacetase [Casimicrobiaceae bacterium]|nr:fumarylacetoacetase [Casimicrobiaceae bacterium]
MFSINDTHDPSLRSFVASANEPGTDFPIQNLPFGVIRRAGSKEEWRGAVAIGDQALDLAAVAKLHLLSGLAAQAIQAAAEPTLNRFMEMGPEAHSALRAALSRLLAEGSPQEAVLRGCLIPLSEVEHAVPARIGDYTDFYASIHHATNVGRLFRPENPLLPNYRWVPIGYHGRASSIRVSGQRFPRPVGQVCPPGQSRPSLQASQRLDYELELGLFIGAGNVLGEPIPIEQAERHIFGLCLLNDWSARDLQAWEYQPLGPFLAKNFATTISPWIVTWEALAPFRAPFERAAGEPEPLPYLSSLSNTVTGALDLRLEVHLETARMRAEGRPPERLSATRLTESMYWTFAQLVTHHTVNGCNLQPGDLLGSGTLSGPTPGSQGALIELTEGGKRPLTLANGETRIFLEDGDAIMLSAWAEREGFVRIGLGSCRGELLPAREADLR